MTGEIELRVLDDPGLVEALFPEHVKSHHIRTLIGHLTSGAIDPGYNVLLDFTATSTIEFPASDMIELAMKRRRELPAYPGKPLRSAIIGERPAIAPLVEMWEGFFFEDPPAIIFRRFSSREQALNWITEPR